MGLWVPPAVSAELVREREMFAQELRDRVLRQEMLRVKGVLDEFNYELRRIDPKLELVRAGEDVEGTPMKAGYYHLVRWNEGAPPSVIPIEGEHGEFVEPTSRVFEMLARADLWNPDNMRLLRQRKRLAEEADRRRKTREREERQEHLRDLANAAFRTQVSMNRDTPWTQNWSANSRRDAAARRKAS